MIINARVAAAMNLMKVLLLVILSVVGCRDLPSEQARVECDWERFRTLGYQAKQAALSKCSSKKKVDLFLKWTFATIPANNDLVDTMASFGDSIIPEVLLRIEKSEHLRDDIVKPELLFILTWMQSRGYYAVLEDARLMNRLQAAIAGIEELELRKACEGILKSLEE